MEENRNYVGMENCFFCGKVKSILLQKNLMKTLPQNAVYNKEPCENCKVVMEFGVLFIGVRNGENGNNPYRTGQIIGLKEKAVKEWISEPLLSDVLKNRVCFVEEDVLNKMGLIDNGGNLKYEKDETDNLIIKRNITRALE